MNRGRNLTLGSLGSSIATQNSGGRHFLLVLVFDCEDAGEQRDFSVDQTKVVHRVLQRDFQNVKKM